MPAMPKVSVIIPVYNVEQYIERCARSLFEQTLDDIEYIFVNDCTPDKSMEVLARVLDDYPTRKDQVRIIDMPVNSGQAKVRKVGIEAATGDYIIHCDSDDWVDVTIYEKMWRKAVTEDLDMVICGFFFMDGERIISTNLNDYKGFETLKCAIIANEIAPSLWSKLIRKGFYNNIDEWPVFNYGEDMAILIPITYQCKSIGRLDEPLYFYYLNPKGICESIPLSTKIEQQIANTDFVTQYITKHGGGKNFHTELLHRKCSVKMNCWKLPWREYLSIYPETNLYLLFDSNISLVEKMGHLTKCLGIHGISKLFSHGRESQCNNPRLQR